MGRTGTFIAVDRLRQEVHHVHRPHNDHHDVDENVMVKNMMTSMTITMSIISTHFLITIFILGLGE